MFSLHEYRAPGARLPDKLPWAHLIAPGVILQKGCVLQKTVAYRGPDLAASLPSELAHAVLRLNNALKRLGGGWALFSEAERSEASEYPASEWPTLASRIVDEERRRYFEAAGSHFESKYYLTFAWALPSSLNSKLSTVFYDTDGEDEEETEEAAARRDLTYFQKNVAEIVDIMRGVFPQVDELSDDQTLTYLHGTISTQRHPVRTPENPSYLDAFLPDEPFTPGEIPMLGDHYIACSTIVGFPATTFAGVLDDLNRLHVGYRWMTRFIAMDKDEARSILERKRRHWYTKRKSILALIREEATKEPSPLVDNSATSYAQDADAALQELGLDIAAFGYLTTTLVVWDRDRRAVLQKRALLKKAVQSCGFVVRDETLNSTQAWLGSLPGHCYANVRKPIVNTLNLAHMMPVSAVWAGPEVNEHLARVTGLRRAHVYCSAAGTPFRLSTNVGDVGHTLMIGTTGAGKSTALNLLAMQFLKFPGSRVVFFDKGRSALAATLVNGGVCYEPGNSDAGFAFQPLAQVDSTSERYWAAEFVLRLLEQQKVRLTSKVKTAVDETLVAIAALPRERRTLTLLASQLGTIDHELRPALRPYTVDGNFGKIFDAEHEEFRCTRWTMIEMGHLMQLGEEVVVPALEYLFHRIEAQFDGQPTLLIIDEAWLFLQHPVFARRLQEWLKTLRKRNVYVIFATQEIADATAKAALLSTILAACYTQILLPSRVLASTPALADAYRSFGLSEAEIRLLSAAEPARDYYYRSPRGRRLFSFAMGPATLAFVGMSSPEDQGFLDRMVREHAPSDFTRAVLEYRGVPWERYASAVTGTPSSGSSLDAAGRAA
jgi:type IV secretion/conjugal transfer VirB4 family ATPase